CDDGMNRVRPAGAWSRVLALVPVLVVVLVLMFVEVPVAAIMIVTMPGFMARHPNVVTKAGAERRTSHSAAGTAAPSKGAFCRGGALKPIMGHLSIVSRADPEPMANALRLPFSGVAPPGTCHVRQPGCQFIN